MSTTHNHAKTLLVSAIGAAVLGIGLVIGTAAAPAALAEQNGPTDGNHIPILPGDLYPQPPAKQYPLPQGGSPHPGGWGGKQYPLPPGGTPHPGGWGPH